MGEENFTIIYSVLPSIQFPNAPITLTGEGPDTEKSVPFEAIVPQLIFFGKYIFIESGAQPGLPTLSAKIGCGLLYVNETSSPCGITLSQLSRSVLLSLPLLITRL